MRRSVLAWLVSAAVGMALSSTIFPSQAMSRPSDDRKGTSERLCSPSVSRNACRTFRNTRARTPVPLRAQQLSSCGRRGGFSFQLFDLLLDRGGVGGDTLQVFQMGDGLFPMAFTLIEFGQTSED